VLQHALPSLFGRFTALLAGHETRSLILRRLEELCDALEDGQKQLAWRIRPPTLVLDLQESLLTHFAVEEANTYFGAIVAERPELCERVAVLSAEHAVMSAMIAHLRELAPYPERWPEMAVPSRVLLGLLHAHEQAEARLLQDFLTGAAS
jgi:hypothetical protein